MICHSCDSAVKPVLSFKADPCSPDSAFRGHCPSSGALKFACQLIPISISSSGSAEAQQEHYTLDGADMRVKGSDV